MNFKKLIKLNNNTIIFLIFIVAIILRFFHLGKDSIFLDEAYCIRVVLQNFFNMLSLSVHDSNPPLYNILLFFWSKLFGHSEFAIRSLSAIFSIATVPLVYIATKLIINNNKIPLFTTIIFALSPFQIFYAQMARSYSLFMLLSVLFIFFLIQMNNLKNKKIILGYVISASLLLYTHFYAWFILLFGNAWIVINFIIHKKKIKFKKLFSINLIVLILFSPYLYYFIQAVFNSINRFWIKKPALINLIGTFVQFSGSPELFILFSILLSYMIFQFYKNENIKTIFKRKILLLSFWIITTIFVPFLLSLIIKPFFLGKYCITTSFPFYIFLALSISLITNKKMQIWFFIIYFSITSYSLYKDYSENNREPWRKLVTTLEETANENDLILIGANYCYFGPVRYYLSVDSLNIFPISNRAFPKDSVETIINLHNKKNSQIIFIASHFNNYEKIVLNILKVNYKIFDKKVFTFIDFFDRRIPIITLYKLEKR